MPLLRSLRSFGFCSTKILLLTELKWMKNGYEMIIWWSAEDDAYVVDVPELPGCMAHDALVGWDLVLR